MKIDIFMGTGSGYYARIGRYRLRCEKERWWWNANRYCAECELKIREMENLFLEKYKDLITP